jgi:Leucine-rich repeat (LRR) protein
MQRIHTQISQNTGTTYSPLQDAQSNYIHLTSLLEKGEVNTLEYALNHLSLPQEKLHLLLYAAWSQSKFDIVGMMCTTTSFAPNVLATIAVDALEQGQVDQRKEAFAFALLNNEKIKATSADKALHVAAARGRNLNKAVDLIQKLLGLGANVLSVENDMTAAQVADACLNRDPETYEFLFHEQSSQGWDPSLNEKRTEAKAEKEVHQKKMQLSSFGPTEQVSPLKVPEEIRVLIGQLLRLQDLLRYGSTSKEFNHSMQAVLKDYTRGISIESELTGTALAILKKVSCLSMAYSEGAKKLRLENIGQLISNLQTLSLFNKNASGAGMREVGKLTNLHTLNLKMTVLTDAGMREVGKLTNLQRLDLAQTKVTDAGMAEVGKLTNLKELDLNHTLVTDVGLPEVGKLANLQSLDLRCTKVTDVGLPEVGKLTNLQSLYVSGMKVTDVGLTEVGKLTNLQSLYLYCTKVTDVWMTEVGKLTNLKELNLVGTKVTDVGLREVGKLTNLQSLYLASMIHKNTGVTSSGMREVGKLANLRTLNLCGTAVTDPGMQKVGKLTSLQSLNLKGTSVTDVGMPEVGKLTNLQSLDLGAHGVTDEGVRHLLNLTQLGRLNLAGAKITPNAPLLHLKNLTNLKYLTVSDTTVSRSWRKTIEKAMPKLDITFLS